MGGSCWLWLLVGGATLLSIIHCDVVCPRDGRPGVNGAPGQDGFPGPKGDKGEPALLEHTEPFSVRRLKGAVGPRGAQGPLGPKGYSGQLGPPGVPGLPGEPGTNGKQRGKVNSPLKHSAFSVMRMNLAYPPYNQPVTFDRSVVNDPEDFNIGSGYFNCSVAGVYYFSFTSMAKVSMCLSINSDATREGVAFCDLNRQRQTDQVLTGGLVLELKAGQRVWLKSFRDIQQPPDSNDRRPKQIIFNGFLIS